MMNFHYRLFVLVSLIATSLMIGCSEKPKTVEWYMEHKPEREAKLQYCRDDSSRAATPDCLNAEKAAERVVVDSKVRTIDTFKFSPPVQNKR
jgi:hypothetical protein